MRESRTRPEMRIAPVAATAWRLVALMVAGLLGTQASAQDLGVEWTSLTTEDAAIVFSALGLDQNIVRYMRATDPGHKGAIEVAFWGGPAARHAKAVIRYVKLYPPYGFRVIYDPKTVIRDMNMFEDKKVGFESLESTRNSLGQVKLRRFHFDDVNCMVFSQVFGVHIDWEGDQSLSGYYCADPDENLTAEMIEAAVKGIGVD